MMFFEDFILLSFAAADNHTQRTKEPSQSLITPRAEDLRGSSFTFFSLEERNRVYSEDTGEREIFWKWKTL